METDAFIFIEEKILAMGKMRENEEASEGNEEGEKRERRRERDTGHSGLSEREGRKDGKKEKERGRARESKLKGNGIHRLKLCLAGRICEPSVTFPLPGSVWSVLNVKWGGEYHTCTPPSADHARHGPRLGPGGQRRESLVKVNNRWC